MSIRFPAFFLIALFCFPGAFTVLPVTYAEDEESRKNDFSFMARIKGGTFKRGSTFNETKEYLKLCRKTDRTCQLWWFEDELPQKLIELDSFWIDIFEVTNARYLEFVQATGHRPALGRNLDPKDTKKVVDTKSNHISKSGTLAIIDISVISFFNLFIFS